jgi:hypothetical protein
LKWREIITCPEHGPGKGQVMKSIIRLGVIVAVTLASSAAWSRARADDDQNAAYGSTDKEEATVPAQPGKDVFEPGAASSEPPQAIEEAPGTNAHHEWVESIWSSP